MTIRAPAAVDSGGRVTTKSPTFEARISPVVVPQSSTMSPAGPPIARSCRPTASSKTAPWMVLRASACLRALRLDSSPTTSAWKLCWA
jgi:hypothetical protein